MVIYTKKTSDEKFDNIFSTIKFDDYVETTIHSTNEDKERIEKKYLMQLSNMVDEANRSIMTCY